MQQPLVSIIMGAYNEENNIAQCIDSIMAQTYKNWEFIICDDCSIDKTNDILMDYAKEDGRIHILNNTKNLGLAASLNKCISAAGGGTSLEWMRTI